MIIENMDILDINYCKLFSIDWSSISWHQTLSLDFIEKFQDKVDWGNISIRQKLSPDFIEKFQDKIY